MLLSAIPKNPLEREESSTIVQGSEEEGRSTTQRKIIWEQ